MRSRHVRLLLVLLGYAAADDVVSLDVATPKAPPPAKPYSSAAEAAPSEMADMRVVFSKVKPPDELYWKSEL